MKFAPVPLIALASIVTPTIAQETKDAPAPVAEPQSVQKAESVLVESAGKYASAKALTDVISFNDGTQTQTMNIAIAGDDAVRIALDDITFTVVNGSLYAERANVDELYAQIPAEGAAADTLMNHVGFAPPQLVVRSTKEPGALVEAWTFGMLPMATISGHAMAKNDAGAEMHEITLASPAGRGVMHIDSDSMLMQQVKVTLTMEGSPEMTLTLSYSPKIVEAVNPPIAFSPGERKKVSAIEDLKIDLTGKMAPDFTLESIDGGTVTLSELKGNVVVLDFWATWCVPCKRALPSVSEFAKWAKDNNKPVKVFGVDVWERSTPEETRQAVSEYWKSSNFVMPTLYDFDGAVAKKFAFDAIPTTMIIAPDGKVFAVHTGAGDDIVELLKKDVEGALASVKQ